MGETAADASLVVDKKRTDNLEVVVVQRELLLRATNEDHILRPKMGTCSH
jgi:hypothetical protein